jgi:hypothetical protein
MRATSYRGGLNEFGRKLYFDSACRDVVSVIIMSKVLCLPVLTPWP